MTHGRRVSLLPRDRAGIIANAGDKPASNISDAEDAEGSRKVRGAKAKQAFRPGRFRGKKRTAFADTG